MYWIGGPIIPRMAWSDWVHLITAELGWGHNKSNMLLDQVEKPCWCQPKSFTETT